MGICHNGNKTYLISLPQSYNACDYSVYNICKSIGIVYSRGGRGYLWVKIHITEKVGTYQGYRNR